jgi:CTP:molybdopterin cytidylyltransferase MocA
MNTAAVVLAAGGGSRFDGGHKLLAAHEGHPLIWWSVSNALYAGISPTWVVVGAVDLTEFLPPGASVLWSPHWARGQAASLQIAVEAAAEEGLDAIVVGLGDQPAVEPDAWKAVASSDAPIAVATYDGQRRNPVRLSSAVWPLLPTDGDVGARAIMQERPDLVTEIPCQGDPRDIDTREDLERWT